MIPCTLLEPDLATSWASRVARSEQGILLLCAAWDVRGASLRLTMTSSMLCAGKGALE